MGLLKSLRKNTFTKTVMCGLMVSGGMMAGMSQADAAAPATGKVGDTYNFSNIGMVTPATSAAALWQSRPMRTASTMKVLSVLVR